MLRPVLLALALVALTSGCHQTTPTVEPEDTSGPRLLEDVTARVGLSFQHDAGPPGNYRLPVILGSGGACLDFDNDGKLDLYLVHNGGRRGKFNQLFRQKDDGTFENVSADSGLEIRNHGMGVAVGDFDNDGWVDVYLSQYTGGRLFRNRGKNSDGRWLGFEDVTKPGGVELSRWGASCAFVDYDRDGWLDLVVVNYVDYDPARECPEISGRPEYCRASAFAGTATRLFRNRGRDTNGPWRGFEDVTLRAGLASTPGPGLGILCTDFDGDGWPDLFVTNDGKPNHLWINQKDGTFKEEAVQRGVAIGAMLQPHANRGVAFGDVDGDGLFDLVLPHAGLEGRTLWRQSARGTFVDGTEKAGLGGNRGRVTGFGTALIDFDHDGRLDLAIVNGSTTRHVPQKALDLEEFWHSYAERNQVFVNDGKGKFQDVSGANKDFCGKPGVHRGLIWGDFDQDGAMDLVVTSVAGPVRFFRNVAEKKGRWLMVRALDPVLRRDAIGARVTIRAGERQFLGEVCPAQGYLCSGDPRVHFGLGAIDRVDEMRVDWPDGLAEIFAPVTLDRHVTVERGKGKKVQP